MGTKRNTDMSQTETEVKIVANPDEQATTEITANAEETPKKVIKPKKIRGKNYQSARAQVDKTKTYEPQAAIELVKKLSFTKFDATLEAHAVVKKIGTNYTLTFPYSTGKQVKVAIFSDKVLKQIEDGKLDFDVLLATKADMPKLTKLARTLGPKGLMPNPKNGTLTQDPAAKKKELEAGSIQLKTEKKAPLIHLTFGKISMDDKALVENLQALIKVLGLDLSKLSIASSMSPGVRVKLD